MHHAGLYRIGFQAQVDAPGTANSNHEVFGQIRVNDTTDISGSEARVAVFDDAQISGNTHTDMLCSSILYEATAGDWATMQVKHILVGGSGSASIAVNATFAVTRLTGEKGNPGEDGVDGTNGTDGSDGAPGPAGSGSNVLIKDEDGYITATPHSVLNFTGAAVTAADVGNGQVDITITGGGGDQLFTFDPNMATFPASNPAAATSRNEHPLISFDDTTAESIIFHWVMTNDYNDGYLTIDIDWVAATATTNSVVWGVEIERIAPGGTDIGADSFDSQQVAASTTNGTSGVVTRTSIGLNNSDADAILAGDAFRLRIQRVAGNGGDDMTGDAQLLRVSGRQ
jgi:hypothetical protein